MAASMKYDKLFYYLGILAPSVGIGVVVNGNIYGLWNFLVVFIILKKFLENMNIGWNNYPVTKDKYKWILFFVAMLLSSVFSAFYLPAEWYSSSIFTTVKYIVVFVGIIGVFSKYELDRYRESFFKGIIVIAVIQSIWAMLQIFCWYDYGININMVVFGEIMGATNTNWNQSIMGGIIPRMSGFSWEPANFAFLIAVALTLTRSIFLKVLFGIILLLSTSKTGLVLLIMIILYNLTQKLRSVDLEHISIKITIKRIIITILSFVVLITSAIEFSDYIIAAYESATNLLDSLEIAIMTADNESANTHKIYYTRIWDVVNSMTVIQLFLGYGSFCAGYPYHVNNIVFYGVDKVWNPESDFITLFIGNGLLGAIIYYYIIGKVIIKSKNYRLLTMLILIAGITYGFFRGSWSVLILLMIEQGLHVSISNTDFK